MRKTSIDAYMHVVYTGAKGFIRFIYMRIYIIHVYIIHVYIIHVYIIHVYIIHVYIKTQKKKTYIVWLKAYVLEHIIRTLTEPR